MPFTSKSLSVKCYTKAKSFLSYCLKTLVYLIFLLMFVGACLAPDRPPLNVQWTMVGSTLSLHWDPVVATETESKVTGYLVGPTVGFVTINLNQLQKSFQFLNIGQITQARIKVGLPHICIFSCALTNELGKLEPFFAIFQSSFLAFFIWYLVLPFLSRF